MISLNSKQNASICLLLVERHADDKQRRRTLAYRTQDDDITALRTQLVEAISTDKAVGEAVTREIEQEQTDEIEKHSVLKKSLLCSMGCGGSDIASSNDCYFQGLLKGCLNV